MRTSSVISLARRGGGALLVCRRPTQFSRSSSVMLKGISASSARSPTATTGSWFGLSTNAASPKPATIETVGAPTSEHELRALEEQAKAVETNIIYGAARESLDSSGAGVKGSASSKPDIFAVDAPNGEHDLEDVEEHAKAVEEIIEFAASHENPDEINALHETGKPEFYAVDAPNGEHDLEDVEEHKKGVEEIIEFAATHENADEINAMHDAAKPDVFAVDAPDGEHDLEDVEEHKKGVDEIIEFASTHENPDEINEMHNASKPDFFAVDAPDGEHDLEDVEEHIEQVRKIIDYAADHENPNEVKQHQKLEQDTRAEAEKHPEHDW